jgi:hypothetical protein
MPGDDKAQRSETVEEQEMDGVRHRPAVNQRQHEPVPASSHAGKDQPSKDQPTKDEHSKDPATPARRRPHAVPGDAVRDMMGGPSPQGDVPDAPAVQVATSDQEEDEDGKPTRARYVANAVPGKPDGEVDTRFGYTGT